MSLRQRVDELEKEIRALRGELVAVRNDLFKKTMFEYLIVYNGISYGENDSIPIKVVMQMLMDQLGLKIQKTPEKVSLEVITNGPLKDSPRN